jgi:hypothetical protein
MNDMSGLVLVDIPESELICNQRGEQLARLAPGVVLHRIGRLNTLQICRRRLSGGKAMSTTER